MKTKVLSLLVLLFAFNYVSAQTNQGTVTYNVTLDQMDMPNVDAATQSQMKAMMKNITLAIAFKDKNFRADLDMGMAKGTTLKVNGKTTVLSETMGMKYKINGEDLEKMNKGAKEEEYEVELTNETKMIAGYECKKAIIKMKDGKTATIYYTDKLSSSFSEYAQYSKFKAGCPMEFSMNKNGMIMTMVASKVSTDPVSDDMFKIPDGYQQLTAEQLKQMSGGK